MKRGLLLGAVLLAGCGSTTTITRVVHQPPSLGAASGEAATPQPTVKGFKPKHGNPEPATFRAASGCGVERWAVKTGTDPGASSVNLTPQDSTVADLAAITPPASPTDRVAPTETAVFHLHATVQAVKQEADSDYHLAIADGSNTMIAESPATSCDSGSVFSSQIQAVRAAIDAACPGIGGTYQNVSIPADLTGVGFFDRIHGQRGVAPNGVELHPLLAIKFGGHC